MSPPRPPGEPRESSLSIFISLAMVGLGTLVTWVLREAP